MILKKELFPANYFCPQCRLYAEESLNWFQQSLKREEDSRLLSISKMTRRYRLFRARISKRIQSTYARRLAEDLCQMRDAHETLLRKTSEELEQYLKEARAQQLRSLIESSENICLKISNILTQLSSHKVLSILVHPEDFNHLQKFIPESLIETLISDEKIDRGNFVLKLTGQGQISYDWKHEFSNWL